MGKISIWVQWNSQSNLLTFSFVNGSEQRRHRNEVHQEAETLATVKGEKKKVCMCVGVCGGGGREFGEMARGGCALSHLPTDAQFPSSATAHLGSGRSIPRLGCGGDGQIIANPVATHAVQSDDKPKDFVFCLRLSNEHACYGYLRRWQLQSHHQSRQNPVRLTASPLRLIARRVKNSQYN